MVKEFLSRQGVQYEERDVSANAAYAQELRKSGQLGVPVTVINDEMVIGFDRERLSELIEKSRSASKPNLGASVADAGKMPAGATGAYVGKVKPGSAAARLGLSPGDIIIGVNGTNINNSDDLGRVVSGLNPGSRLAIVLLRQDKKVAVEGVI